MVVFIIALLLVLSGVVTIAPHNHSHLGDENEETPSGAQDTFQKVCPSLSEATPPGIKHSPLSGDLDDSGSRR